MKYKCIKEYYYYDSQIMDIGDIVVIENNKLYNITKKIDFNNLSCIDELMKHLESITDDQKYTEPMDEHPFQTITNEMFETYLKKNHDYGNSFNKSLDKFGIIASVVRMEDKFNRIESLIKKEAKVADESISDTLLDLANYCIMTKMWLDNGSNR